MKNYDAIIIGAGVVGCSISLALNRNGLRTLNVDALGAPGQGSTSHSSAIIRPFYSHATAAALAHESRHRWQHWTDFLALDKPSEHARYTESGGTLLYTEEQRERYSANLQVLEGLGIEYSHLNLTELADKFPGIDLQGFGPPVSVDHPQFGCANDNPLVGGIHIPACGYVNDPQLAANNLYQAACESGGQFSFNKTVTQIDNRERHTHRIKLDDGSRIESKILINAAGPHSSQINALAQVSLAIATAPHRHEVVYLKSPFPDGRDAGFLVDTDGGFYQRSDGADILIGSVDPACDAHQIVDPSDPAPGFSNQWTLQAYRAAQRFPKLGIESKARGTIGSYDVSDDWIPVYDKTDLPGYFVAIGTSGNQFKNAPLIGDLISAIVMHNDDHDQSPAHLQLPHLDQSLNLSFYSRLRKVQATASVLA